MAGVRTTCPYCGVGCGVLAGGGPDVKGDTAHPANGGRLCSKGSALGLTLDDSTRLTHPTISGTRVSWDTALDEMAAQFSATIAQHGPDSVAFYVSGQFLTEDYYVANKLMKGFIGSANIDTNSRLCMASTVAGHVRAFGEDVVPGVYEDWEEANLVVLVGSNTAWCHPILYQRLLASREVRGTKIVVIDPRRTATAEQSDQHLPLKIGSDVALFSGLLAWLEAEGRTDPRWIDAHANGFAEAIAVSRAQFGSIDQVARVTGIAPDELVRFYRLWSETERTVTVFSQGVNQSDAGTDKVNAIINCHLATGRIGRPGMGPFSVTGQPNAMGGREVGGLANQLAAHMRLDSAEDRDRVRRFWNAPNLASVAGLKAVDLFRAVASGKVKALWIAATNPAVSMPEADLVRQAIEACPFVVVSDCWPTDTTNLARVVLPAAGWGEKDGTVTNSDRTISRQRPFRTSPGEAKPDWWMFAELARRMGWTESFSWDDPAAIFREHAALTSFENDGRRMLNLGPLSTMSDEDYEQFTPTRWPITEQSGAGRLFGDGGFPTPDGKARFVATAFRPPASSTERRRPFRLNSGRIRDQWHTMTRTGLAPRLLQHQSQPMLSLASEDAARLGVSDGDLVRIDGAGSRMILPVQTDTGQRQGECFAPFHWTDMFTTAGALDRLVAADVDPISGQPALKSAVVAIAPVPILWRAVMVRGDAAVPKGEFYAVRVPAEDLQVFDLAGWTPLPHPSDRLDWAARLLASNAPIELGAEGPVLVLDANDRIESCLWLAEAGSALPGRDQILSLIGETLTDQLRAQLSSTRPVATKRVSSQIVCACHSVSREVIETAIRAEKLTSVGAIGRCMKAGTNCGSCIPELEGLLREMTAAA